MTTTSILAVLVGLGQGGDAAPDVWRLVAADAAEADLAGWAVAAGPGLVLLGVREDDDAGESSGSVRAFTERWSETARLVPHDAGPRQRFGSSVAVDGDLAVIGARTHGGAAPQAGAAYVFRRGGGAWRQEARLRAPDARPDDQLGWSVAVSGDVVVVGLPFRAPSGAVWTFREAAGVWRPAERLDPTGPSARHFGSSVAVDGSRLLVGDEADAAAGVGSGAVTLYERRGSGWEPRARWAAPAAGAAFGRSIALRGDRALIGAPHESRDAPWAGAAYLFTRSEGRWAVAARLTAPDAGAWDELGHAVAMGPDRVVVGAPGDDDAGAGAGAAYLFEIGPPPHAAPRIRKLAAPDAADDDRLGWSVALAGRAAVAGAPHRSTPGFWAGAAYVFGD